MEVETLRQFGEAVVCVHLADGTERRGRLRTDLLSARSISVYLDEGDGNGATLYLDDINDVRAEISEGVRLS